MKHRIIFDTVTGRIDIRNEFIPEYEYMDEEADEEEESADDIEEQED